MDMVHISVGSAAIVVIMGMAVVFFGLILLMWVVQITSKIMIRQQEKASAAKAAEQALKAAEQAVTPDKKEAAPETAGELKLYDTDPRDAAMIMAIVADATGKPLNELRFKSIREVKEGDGTT